VSTAGSIFKYSDRDIHYAAICLLLFSSVNRQLRSQRTTVHIALLCNVFSSLRHLPNPQKESRRLGFYHQNRQTFPALNYPLLGKRAS
jgi:hypothetical protein